MAAVVYDDLVYIMPHDNNASTGILAPHSQRGLLVLCAYVPVTCTRPTALTAVGYSYYVRTYL